MHETDIYSCFQIHHMFIKLTKQFTTKTTFLISPLFLHVHELSNFYENSSRKFNCPRVSISDQRWNTRFR